MRNRRKPSEAAVESVRDSSRRFKISKIIAASQTINSGTRRGTVSYIFVSGAVSDVLKSFLPEE